MIIGTLQQNNFRQLAVNSMAITGRRLWQMLKNGNRNPKVFHILNHERTDTLCGRDTWNEKEINTFNNPSKPLCKQCERFWDTAIRMRDDFHDYIPEVTHE